MIYRLYLWLFGYVRFYIDDKNSINYIVAGIRSSRNIRKDGDTVVFDISRLALSKTLKLLNEGGYTNARRESRGLPARLYRYRKRWGLYAGVVIFIFIVWFSSCFVWKINIVGNEKIDDQSIIEGLDRLGFRVGSFIPSVNVKLLCNDFMLENDGVAWMSINIIGTHADVRVREALDPKGESESSLPSVITAKRDGFIERIELSNGQIIIKSGSSVREGETIVSGVVEKKYGGFRLVRSSAKIYAKTTHEYSVFIPFAQEEEQKRTAHKADYSIVFFSSSFSLPGRPTGEFEEETTTRYLSLPGGITLPFGISKTEYYDVILSETTIDSTRAASLAEKELARLISDELSEAEILSITKDVKESGDGCTLNAVVCCIEDIGQERPLFADDYGANPKK